MSVYEYAVCFLKNRLFFGGEELWDKLNRCFVLQNFRKAKNSAIMFSAYWKYFFVWHSSEYETSDNSQTANEPSWKIC